VRHRPGRCGFRADRRGVVCGWTGALVCAAADWLVCTAGATGRCMRRWTGVGWMCSGCGRFWPVCRCRVRLVAGWCWRSMSIAGCGRTRTPARNGSCVTLRAGQGSAHHDPGWPYSFVVALETGHSSWTAPLDVVRLSPGDDLAEVTAAQLREVVTRLVAAGQWRQGDPDILVVADAGYDRTRLAWLLGDLPVQVIARMRSDRVLRRATGPRSPGTLGRPRRHGTEFLRRPWETPAPLQRLSPARVRRGFRHLRAKTTTKTRKRRSPPTLDPAAQVKDQARWWVRAIRKGICHHLSLLGPLAESRLRGTRPHRQPSPDG
jgi:hypothetical protein